MPSRRVQRLNEQFKRELMDILLNETKDPRVSGITVTAVEVTPDLSFARVFITSLAPLTERPGLAAGLDAAKPFIRGEIARRIRLRKVPDLHFSWDESRDHARRIEELLAEVKRGQSPPQSDE